MNEKPQLVIKSQDQGEPMSYQCSSCGQTFTLREDRSPKEAVAQLYGAFKEHVQEEHADRDGLVGSAKNE